MFGGFNTNILIGLIMIAISFVVFPIVLSGAQSVLDQNLSAYTGLQQIVSIGPMLVFVMMLFGGLGLTGMGVYRAVRRRRKKKAKA